MRVFARIVIEQQAADHWTAWMATEPQNAVGGVWPADALARLLLLIGAEKFETDETSAIDEATRAGHLEFRIPYRRLKRMSVLSMN